MKLDAQLSFTKFRHDQDSDAHLVLTLTAPVKDGEAARPAICIVPVIDVSGSMSGPKLDYAKRSAIKLIEHLKVGDYCGLIAFDSTVRTVVEPQRLTLESKDRIKAEIGKLRTGGSTNFSGGLLAAMEAVDKLDLAEGVLQRIVMFTDGQANAGIATKAPDIIRLLTNAGRATVSAFGYGSDVDQQFLLDFSKTGKGNYAFIQDPDGALTAFGKELGGLLSTYATNLVVRLDPLAGHEITSVVSDVEAEQEAIGGNVTIRVPDILGEESRNLVLAVRLKEQKQAFPRAVNTFDVKVEFDVIDATGKKERKTAEVKVKAHFVKEGEEDKTPIEALDNVIALAQVIRAQIEAEELAKKGNYVAAASVMQATADRTRRRGRLAAAGAAEGLAARLGDQEVYGSRQNQAYLRSFQAGGTRGMGAAMYAADAQVELQSLGVVLQNSTQASTSTSFTEGAESVPAVNVVPAVAPAVPGANPLLMVQPLSVGPVEPLVGPSLTGSIPDPALAALWATPEVPVEPEAPKMPIKQARSSRW